MRSSPAPYPAIAGNLRASVDDHGVDGASLIQCPQLFDSVYDPPCFQLSVPFSALKGCDRSRASVFLGTRQRHLSIITLVARPQLHCVASAVIDATSSSPPGGPLLRRHLGLPLFLGHVFRAPRGGGGRSHDSVGGLLAAMRTYKSDGTPGDPAELDPCLAAEARSSKSACTAK